jgi:hypothetical protein
MTIYTLRPFIKHLSVRRRYLGITVRRKLEAKRLRNCLNQVRYSITVLAERGFTIPSLTKLYLLILQKYIETRYIPLNLLPPYIRRNVKIQDLRDEDIPTDFRFRSKQQLYRLLHGFQFPEIMRIPKIKAFTGEEILLRGLYKLSWPHRLSDRSIRNFFGFSVQESSAAFNLFLNHLISNWEYLLRDHF